MASLQEHADCDEDRDKFGRADGGAPDGGEEDAKMAVFERWLLDSGAKFPKLVMEKYDDEVRGVHARQRIQPEETIIEIPLSCLITVEMGKETDVGMAILNSNLDLDAPKHVFLMLFMLIDRKNENSRFKPYYDILPPTLSNMPIFWNDEELSLLEGSYLLTQVEERNIAIEKDYESICELCPHFASTATLDEFKWARMCVCSRNFGIIVNSLRTSAMVPYADMLNHYRPRETKWTYDNRLGAFTITAIDSLASGAQVYDSYGQKCNHRFLLNYGFSVENNRESDGFCPNEVPFKFEVPKDDPCYDQKSKFWWNEPAHHARMIRVCVSENENTRLALACLRVLAADLTEMTKIAYASHSVRDIRFPISVRNEMAAMKRFIEVIDEKLSLYPTTLQQDMDRLADSSLKPFSNERHAVIQVKGEKEVLHHYRRHCEVALEMLAMDVAEDLDDALYTEKFQSLHEKGESENILRYCEIGHHGTVGYLRRLERKRIMELRDQQAHQAAAAASEGGSSGGGAFIV